MGKKKYSINCLFCGNHYIAAKITTKFCSRSCGSRWNHKNNKNFKKTLNNLKYETNRIEKVCTVCKKKYIVIKSRENKTKYCSASCKSTAIYEKNKYKMIENARKVCSGRVAPNRGVPHKIEALRKITKASLERPNGYFNVKYKKYKDKKGRVLSLKSSWEIAFVEQYLDKYNLEWEYEPKMFSLSSGKFYFPDFYDKTNNTWYEIKGFEDKESIEKYNLFKAEYSKLKSFILRKRELEEDFDIDLSTRKVKLIMKKWRIYG